MTADPDKTRTAILTALEALERGDRATAQRLAWHVAARAPESEAPWLILAALASPADSLAYIQKALQINPDSQPAQQALVWALERQRAQSPAPEPEPPPPTSPDLPAEPPPPTRPGLPAEPSPERVHLPTPAPAIPAEPPAEQVHLPTPAPAIPAEPPPPTSPDLPAEPPPPEQAYLPTRPLISAKPPLSASQPPPPVTGRKKSSLSLARIFLFTLLGLVVIALIAGLIFLRPQLTNLLARIFAGDDCRPSLALGTRSFEIRTLKAGSDGSLDVPRNHPERAYWVEGTQTNLVFGLSPAPDNLSLVSALKPGVTTTVTWANCNTATYSLSAPLQGLPDNAALLDQSSSQITIFIPADAGSGGFVLQGELLEETITTFNTPDASALQAEISLLETTTSPDGSTLTVGISIHNYGQVAATLSASDVSLTPEAASALAPVRVEPPLPIEIKAGTTETVHFTFPRPSATTATFKIFTIEFDLEGY